VALFLIHEASNGASGHGFVGAPSSTMADAGARRVLAA